MRKHKNSRRYTESKANARCLESKNKRYARVCSWWSSGEKEKKREKKEREKNKV